MTGQPFTLQTQNSSDFADTMRRLGRFDKVLSSELRASIRDAGKEIVTAVKDQIRSGTYVTNVGTRAGIAKGVRLEVETTTKTAGVRILVNADALPDDRKVMVAAWQKVTFKHPVFGDKGVILEQPGRPYFFKTITDKKPRVTSAVQAAMRRAADSVGSKQ